MPAIRRRAQHHRVDVPVGVVVGEDRLAHVAGRAGRLEVAGAGEDRVDRVVRVLLAVLVGVDAVGLPGRRHELHPAERAGARDVQVAAVVGLDLVDRGQVLPADAVLDAGGLVDRQQEDRHAELADDEVRDRRRGRRAGQRVEEARVGARRGAAGGADRGARARAAGVGVARRRGCGRAWSSSCLSCLASRSRARAALALALRAAGSSSSSSPTTGSSLAASASSSAPSTAVGPSAPASARRRSS